MMSTFYSKRNYFRMMPSFEYLYLFICTTIHKLLSILTYYSIRSEYNTVAPRSLPQLQQYQTLQSLVSIVISRKCVVFTIHHYHCYGCYEYPGRPVRTYCQSVLRDLLFRFASYTTWGIVRIFISQLIYKKPSIKSRGEKMCGELTVEYFGITSFTTFDC